MPELSDDKRAELREAFDHFDSDGNGHIDLGEFSQLLGSLNAGMSDSETEVGFKSIDADGNGTIEFMEFVAWWSEL